MKEWSGEMKRGEERRERLKREEEERVERKREWRERVSEGGWNKLITKYIITLDLLHCWRSTW